jgi:hypothetical protein
MSPDGRWIALRSTQAVTFYRAADLLTGNWRGCARSSCLAAEQEVEFSVRNLAPGVTLTFMIDGSAIATATTDARGRAEVELEVLMPGTTDSR